MEGQTILSIRLSKLKPIIPNLLYNKFEFLGIEDINGVLELDVDEFFKGIRRRVIFQFVDFHYLISNEPEKLLIKYEDNITTKIMVEKNSELGKISINDIAELIDSRLYNKLLINQINNIYHLSKITELEFSEYKSVGKASIILFRKLSLKLREEPEFFLTTYRNKTIPKELPIKDTGYNLNIDLLAEFKRIVNDYLRLLKGKNQRDRDLLIKCYGLFDNEQYHRVEIDFHQQLSFERVRQIKLKHIKKFKMLLEGETLENPFCKIKSDTRKKIAALRDYFKNVPLISFKNLVQTFQDHFQITTILENQKYLNILLEAFDFQVNPKSRISFSETKYYFISPRIDKSLFYETSKYCYDFLRDTVIPITEFDLITSLKRQYSKIPKEYIQIALNQFSEIEKVQDGEKEIKYQIRFNRLKSRADQAERVLYEKGRSMSLDEIVTDINHRLFNLGENKVITRESLISVIRRNKNIIPRGKTGYNSLASWNENSETIFDVIYKSFLHHQKPLTHSEILDYVTTIRPDLQEKSIRTITYNRFLQIEGKKFIILSWEPKYSNMVLSERKNDKVTFKEQIRQLLLLEKNNKLSQQELWNKAKRKLNLKFNTFYAYINDKKLFVKSMEGGVKYVKAVKKAKTFKID